MTNNDRKEQQQHIMLVSEYVDLQKESEIYRFKVPQDVLDCLRKEAPKLQLLEKPPMNHEIHKQHYRDVRFYSDEVPGYSYAGQVMNSATMPPQLRRATNKLKKLLGVPLNGILVNRYNNGEDHILPHSDAEDQCIPQPPVSVTTTDGMKINIPKYHGCYILTVSLGATRTFDILDKTTNETITSFELEDGDGLIMCGQTQRHFLHTIPPQSSVKDVRYSFTYRNHSNSKQRA